MFACLALACAGSKDDSGGVGSCPSWSEPKAVSTVDIAALDEASGLAASVLHPGVLWTHNDDGDDDGVLYAVRTDGTVAGSLTLGGADPEDWESVAVSTGKLYVGDIGDNDSARDQVTILHPPEPEALADNGEAGVVGRNRFSWPDGPRNAEAMLVDPLDGRLLVLSRDSSTSEIMRLPALDSAEDGEPGTIVHTLDLNEAAFEGLGAVRAADVSADGSVVLRLSDGVVWLPGNGSAVDALKGTACEVPNPAEPQGEGVAVLGDTLYFLGEGTEPTLWAVTRSTP